MSRLVRKPTMWFPNRSDTKRAVKSQKRAKLVCAFVFAYEDCWFSHEKAQMLNRTFLT